MGRRGAFNIIFVHLTSRKITNTLDAVDTVIQQNHTARLFRTRKLAGFSR